MSNALAEAPALDMGRAIKWMFKSPNWVNNLMWSVLCVLLGSLVVGHLAMIGYQLEVIQRRSRGRQDDPVDFDPNRFVDYLVRGLVPAAVYLIVAFIFSFLLAILLLVWSGLFAAVMGPHPRDGVALLMLIPIIALILVHAVGVLCIAVPLALRAGLTGDFGQGFNFRWALNTASFMWPTMLLAMLYLFVCSFANLIGLLFCFVGVLVTTAWMQLVMADLGAQLVDIYLAKGGEPVPMQGEALQAEII